MKKSSSMGESRVSLPEAIENEKKINMMSHQDQQKMINTMYEQQRLDAVVKYLDTMNNDWQKESVKVAVVGRKYVGKWTLINRLRKLKHDEPGVTPIKLRLAENGDQVSAYPTDDFKLTYYDLPSVGTEACPFNNATTQDKYSLDYDLDQYDFFLLVISERLESEDLALIHLITRRLNKSYILIHTHMDIARDYYRPAEREKGFGAVKEQVRCELRNSLKREIKPDDIFLIANNSIPADGNANAVAYNSSDEYELNALIAKIHGNLQSFESMKGQALALSTRTICEKAVRAKGARLRSKAIVWAFIAILGSFIPLSGVTALCDTTILCFQINMYADAFEVKGPTVVATMVATLYRSEWKLSIAYLMAKFGEEALKAHGKDTLKAHGKDTLKAHEEEVLKPNETETLKAHGEKALKAQGEEALRPNETEALKAHTWHINIGWWASVGLSFGSTLYFLYHIIHLSENAAIERLHKKIDEKL